MNLVLLILRLLFGRPGDGSSRLMPIAIRSDGRTHSFRGRNWMWNWLRACEEWLKRFFSWPPPSRLRGGGGQLKNQRDHGVPLGGSRYRHFLLLQSVTPRQDFVRV